MAIPFVDLKLQYSLHREEFERAMGEVCASCAFILGPAVERFEKEFAEYLGAAEAVGVGNGTDALRLICQALEIGPGDEVLVPANSFIASAIAVHQAGATPVFVDAEPETYLMDLADAERRLTPRTKAVMPVHLYGQAADMDRVLDFARAHRLRVIEDACQAHGARWKGKRAGTFGAAAAFSFYPGKNIGAFGDGGLVATNDGDLARRVRLLRNYGSTRRYVHELAGGNSRLDALQAAVLSVKLRHLDSWNANRFRAARGYTEGLAGIPGVQPPRFDPNDAARHAFHLYVIQHGRRDALAAHLAERGIQTAIHYPLPIHRQACFAFLGYREGEFPVAESLAGRILSLPMFPEITPEQVRAVIEGIAEFHA